MSDTDSFINEVNEEVRRDRLYGIMRRYGWIAILAIVLIVGGAAFSEYRKAQTRGQAEALGDAMLAGLALEDEGERVAALAKIETTTPKAAAVLALLKAAQQVQAEDTAGAIETLNTVAVNGVIPEIYRQVAQFKLLTLQGDTTPVEDRRLSLDVMSQPGNPLRLLAIEQLALIDMGEGDAAKATERYQMILSDALVSSDLQQRALQVIVALGGEPELGDSAVPQLGQPTEVVE